MKVRLSELAAWIDASIEGDKSQMIDGLAKIEEAQPGQLSFIANSKYAKFAATTQASALLVDFDFPSIDKTLVRTPNPYLAFLKLVEHFYTTPVQIPQGIHETAVIGADTVIEPDCAIGAHVVIGASCHIGRGCVIFPGVVIGDQVTIGNDSLLYANVSVRESCRIGNRVIVQMGAVIGSDGFGYAFEDRQYHKIPQTGIVVLEDDVEVGANTAIDRATLGETRICRGVKLDNLIQIAHNVRIDEHTAIAAQTGISGSTRIGKYAKIGGQAGFVGHIDIGDGTIVGAQAGITKGTKENSFVSGTPAKDFKRWQKEQAALSRLPDVLKTVKELLRKVDQLEEQLAKQKK